MKHLRQDSTGRDSNRVPLECECDALSLTVWSGDSGGGWLQCAETFAMNRTRISGYRNLTRPASGVTKQAGKSCRKEAMYPTQNGTVGHMINTSN